MTYVKCVMLTKSGGTLRWKYYEAMVSIATYLEGLFTCWWISRRPEWIRADFALELLKEKKVAVAPGNTFGEMCRDHIRISIASSEENIREGLGRICAMIQERSTGSNQA